LAALAPLVLWTAVIAHSQQPSVLSSSGNVPFHDFREQTLEYSGPRTSQGIPDDLKRVAIGWFGPSEPNHPLHGDLWTAALLAVEEANLAGGWNGVPFELFPRWSENVWGSGVSQVARMVYEDRAWAILGSVDGASTHLAEQIVAKARLPLVSPISTDESVNLAGVPWMFSVAPADHQWAPALATNLIDRLSEIEAIEDGETETFALITVTDHDSRLATETLLDELADFGRGPALRLDLRPGATALEEHLERLNLSEQAAILLVAGPKEGARLLLALDNTGFEGAIFGTPGLARRYCLETAGDAANGLRVPLLRGPVSDAKNERRFQGLFRQRTGADPDWAAAHTYDATRLLLQAIQTAGLSRTDIRETLAGLSPWQGLTGQVEWDPTGQNRRLVSTVATIRSGLLTVD
jgi:ABC-type branched-subunit amino acid transport system substrate-binding protein